MADVLDPAKRSQVMAAIKGADTKPELRVRRHLHRSGLRFRKNDKRYPGKPDIVLPRHRAAVFVNGCFWHAHQGCRHFKMPRSRQDYWAPKFERNRARDLEKETALIAAGWHVFTVWDCEADEATLDLLAARIRAGDPAGFEAGRTAAERPGRGARAA